MKWPKSPGGGVDVTAYRLKMAKERSASFEINVPVVHRGDKKGQW